MKKTPKEVHLLSEIGFSVKNTTNINEIHPEIKQYEMVQVKKTIGQIRHDKIEKRKKITKSLLKIILFIISIPLVLLIAFLIEFFILALIKVFLSVFL